MTSVKSQTARDKVAISVVSIVKDNKLGLAKTLNSLRSQIFQEWESIIVDGISVDGSLELAKDFVKLDSRFQLINQETTGIYDAMNLGVSAAKGKYLWFLNSGDVFSDQNSLGSAYEIVCTKTPDLLIGGYSYEECNKIKYFAKSTKWIHPLEISNNRRGLCHQSMLYKKESLLQVGGYDRSFVLASDFHSALKISISGKVFRTNLVLSKIELGGVSQSKLDQVLREKQAARKAVFKEIDMYILLGTIWTLLLKIKIRVIGLR
jgi:glycosyltransferase involved in cell wall biosynthesis